MVLRKLKSRFGLKSLFLLLTICAFASVWFARSNHTIRCDYGGGDILGGYLAPGDRVNVMAQMENGEFETVAEHVTTIAQGRWEFENGSNICYVEIECSLTQKWKIGDYPNYRITFPLPK